MWNVNGSCYGSVEAESSWEDEFVVAVSQGRGGGRNICVHNPSFTLGTYETGSIETALMVCKGPLWYSSRLTVRRAYTSNTTKDLYRDKNESLLLRVNI